MQKRSERQTVAELQLHKEASSHKQHGRAQRCFHFMEQNQERHHLKLSVQREVRPQEISRLAFRAWTSSQYFSVGDSYSDTSVCELKLF